MNDTIKRFREITLETAEELGLFPKSIATYSYDKSNADMKKKYFDKNYIGIVRLDIDGEPIELLPIECIEIYQAQRKEIIEEIIEWVEDDENNELNEDNYDQIVVDKLRLVVYLKNKLK